MCSFLIEKLLNKHVPNKYYISIRNFFFKARSINFDLLCRSFDVKNGLSNRKKIAIKLGVAIDYIVINATYIGLTK